MLIDRIKLKYASRKLLPLFILKLIRCWRVSNKSVSTFEGVFDSFHEVIYSYGSQPLYATQTSRLESIKNVSNLMELNSTIVPNWSSQRFNFISTFVSSLVIDKVSILDVGGGFGETYLYLRKSCSKKYDYRILELEPTVELLKKTFKDFSELTCHVSLDSVSFKPEIVYFGSSLQYFSDYKSILLDAISYSPQFIIVSDTPMGNIESFVCAQVNMPETVIPCWVFNYEEILFTLQVAGYKLIYQSLSYYPMHNFDSYPIRYQQVFFNNLIFKKLT